MAALILPVDHPEPLAATLGVMLYPGTDERERRRAAAYAAQYVAGMVRDVPGAQEVLTPQTAHRLFLDAGEPLGDIQQRWKHGFTIGEIVKLLFGLWCSKPAFASWGNAIKIFQEHARRHGLVSSQSALLAIKHQFASVAHLWAAWQFREGRFNPDPAVGYDGYDDTMSFLEEAEVIRFWGQSQSGTGQEGLFFGAQLWQPPEAWTPPVRKPGWPKTGVIQDIRLTEAQMAKLKPAGRPKKRR